MAKELGDGLFTVNCETAFAKEFSWAALGVHGTVLTDGEALDSPRIRAAAGPGNALAYHAAYEFGGDVTALPAGQVANDHTSAFKVLYAMWFVVASGVATGALTGLAISAMRRRSPSRLSAAVAFVVALFLTSTVCLVLYRGLTDAGFMHDALSGVHPDEVNSSSAMPGMGMDMDMDPAHTQPSRLNVVGALTPNLIAVALSVIYAFGGKRRGMRLSQQS